MPSRRPSGPPGNNARNQASFEVPLSFQHNLERPHQAPELAFPQQEVGVGWLAARRLPARERLVYQDSARLEGGNQLREQRPVQVMDADDDVISSRGQSHTR